jgi:hypothetical protein
MANNVGTSICECGAHIDPRGSGAYVSGEVSRFWKEHSKPGHRVIPPEEVMERFTSEVGREPYTVSEAYNHVLQSVTAGP